MKLSTAVKHIIKWWYIKNDYVSFIVFELKILVKQKCTNTTASLLTKPHVSFIVRLLLGKNTFKFDTVSVRLFIPI